MEHIKSYSQFINENINDVEQIDEGVKTWVATALAALSLATTTPTLAANKASTGDDTNKIEALANKSNEYTGTAIGMSANQNIALSKALLNARQEVLKKIGGTTATMSTRYTNYKLIDGGVQIDYVITVGNSNTKQIEQTPTQQKKDHIKSTDDTKSFITNISKKFDSFKLLNGEGSINGAALENIVHRYIDTQTKGGISKFNIRLMSTDEANQIEGGIKWSLADDGQSWAVITPAQ